MKGVYILLIKIGKSTKKRIGALGKIDFDKGSYAYVGSAQNNLEKRVARHMSKNKKMRWHIDYLLDNSSSKVIKVFYKKAGKAEECRIAKILSKTEDPVAGFGCSDCKCGSHLFRIKNIKDVLHRGLDELEVYP